jgi:hypothetical protein
VDCSLVTVRSWAALNALGRREIDARIDLAVDGDEAGRVKSATTISGTGTSTKPTKEKLNSIMDHNWTGFYLGASVGYAFGDTGVALSPSPNFLTINPSPQMFNFIAANGTSTMRPSGFNGGLQAGYKAQVGAIVFGVEADWSYLGLKKSTTTGILLLPDGRNTISYSQSASACHGLIRRRLGPCLASGAGPQYARPLRLLVRSSVSGADRAGGRRRHRICDQR